jgi:hypothetical protein
MCILTYALISNSKLHCIIWHDYGNKDYSVASYLNNLYDDGVPLYHISETMLCFYFSEHIKDIKNVLL